MSIDARARYAESHEFARLESPNLIVGISDHAQAELGDIVFVELPAIGKVLKKGQVFGTVESVKAASDLYMPAGGTIVEVNESLAADPSLVNKEPYGGGWMIKVKPADVKELEGLMDAAAYAKSVGEA